MEDAFARSIAGVLDFFGVEPTKGLSDAQVILMILAANDAVEAITETNAENHTYMPLDSQSEVPNHVKENHA